MNVIFFFVEYLFKGTLQYDVYFDDDFSDDSFSNFQKALNAFFSKACFPI